MFDLPSLSHSEQQAAVEKIHALMAQGMSSGEAIKLIAEEIRREKAAQDALPQSK